MALVESAGAAFATSGTNTVTSGSFTPAAGALVVAIVGIGNGAGIGQSLLTVTDSSGSGTWTLLKASSSNIGAGYAGVWARPAWSGAATVTFTALPNTVIDVCMIVRQFTGAAPVTNQPGATASQFNAAANALSITPAQTGSQCVGGFGNSAAAAVEVANGSTTIYGQYDGGSAGDSEACIKATSLSTAGTPISLGFTNTAVQYSFALAEILAAPAVGPSDMSRFTPGPGWMAWFKQKQPPPAPLDRGPAIRSAGALAMTPLALAAASAFAITSSGGLLMAKAAYADLYNDVYAVRGYGFNAFGQVNTPDKDIPVIRPGTAWLGRFKPGWPRPRPSLPALVYDTCSGGLAMAPLTITAQRGNYGATAMPPLAISGTAEQGVTGPASLNVAAMGMSGTVAVPVIAAAAPPMAPLRIHGTVTVNPSSAGGLVMAPLGVLTPSYLFNPPASFEPGPTWLSRFKKQGKRKALKIPAAQKFIGARGSLAMAGWGYSNGVTTEYKPFPQFPLGLKYEILINGTWLDITPFVYYRDNQVITRGLPDETQEATPGQMTLTLDNRDGRFSPLNTAGAYYPYLTRNTQLRCSVVNVTTTEVLP